MPLKPVTAMRKDKRSALDVDLQHRHFAFIAKVIATSGERNEDKRRWANHFAVALAGTNLKFDRARFFSAVGVDDPYVTQAAYGDDLEDRINHKMQALGEALRNMSPSPAGIGKT